HRAFHVSRDLAWKGRATGVIYGFLRDLTVLEDIFHTNRMAFCFEGEDLLRKKIYPNYKLKRYPRDSTTEETNARNELRHQIAQLRLNSLIRIGFKNIFYESGYESDDLMAAIARDQKGIREVILITADHDMYQCLQEGVVMYSPQRGSVYSHHHFVGQYR